MFECMGDCTFIGVKAREPTVDQLVCSWDKLARLLPRNWLLVQSVAYLVVAHTFLMLCTWLYKHIHHLQQMHTINLDWEVYISDYSGPS